MSDALPEPQRWRWAALLWFLLIGLTLFANPATTTYIQQSWQFNPAFGHSWLVVAVSAWLVWRLRRSLLALTPTPSLLGLVALGAVMFAWWLGYALEIRVLQQLAMTASITGITWALLGTRVTWLLAFPLLYLFLTVSAWDVFNDPMQDATAWLSAHVVRTLGIPLYRDGAYLWIPEGRFLVDQTCSGLRFLLAGLSIGALYAYLTFDDLWRRTLFIGLTALWALLVNVIRVTMVVIAGHLTDMQHPWVYSHVTMGWVLFGVALLVLLLVGNLLQRTPPMLHLGPIRGTEQQPRPASPRALVFAGLVAFSLVAAAPAGAHWLGARAAAASVHASPPDLPHVYGWDGPQAAPATWNPHFPGADAERLAVYESEDGRVYAYVGWYAYERGNAKLLFFDNRLFDPRQWVVTRDAVRHVELDGRGLSVREQVLREPVGYGIRVLWSWYQVDEQATASAMHAKLLGLRGVLRGRPKAMVIALAAEGETEREALTLLHAHLFAASDLPR